MFILFKISDARSWLGVAFYMGSVEFPPPNKTDRFTYMTETERPDD